MSGRILDEGEVRLFLCTFSHTENPFRLTHGSPRPTTRSMAVPETYDDYWINRTRPSAAWDEARVRRVFEPLLGKSRVLDYGCGIGRTYRGLLSSRVGSYAGADVSAFAIQTLNAPSQEGFLINPDNSSISAAGGSFEGVCSIEVFEHLFDPLAAARELFRLLQPGGTLVATVPNFGYHAWRLMALIRAEVPAEPERPRENRYNGVHIRFFCAATFRRLFQDAGFVDVKITSFDDSSIWDITRGFGPLAKISDIARAHLPAALHLRFLQEIWPGLFAYRIRVVARKPLTESI